MTAHASVEQWVENFKWESETQKKGFLALLIFLRDHRSRETDVEFDRVEDTLNAVACWFIQKDHESNEWFNERIGDMAHRLENDLASLADSHTKLVEEVVALQQEVAALKARTQS